jgi:hypothetical protein
MVVSDAWHWQVPVLLKVLIGQNVTIDVAMANFRAQLPASTVSKKQVRAWVQAPGVSPLSTTAAPTRPPVHPVVTPCSLGTLRCCACMVCCLVQLRDKIKQLATKGPGHKGVWSLVPPAPAATPSTAPALSSAMDTGCDGEAGEGAGATQGTALPVEAGAGAGAVAAPLPATTSPSCGVGEGGSSDPAAPTVDAMVEA